jgi:3-oxoacyl-[acyl-carrier protein] reductase
MLPSSRSNSNNQSTKQTKATKNQEITNMSNNIPKKLADKVAVVTGASKGIGASIAKHLAAEGAAVVVNYASSKAGADKVVGEIIARGGQAIAVQADVAWKADIERCSSKRRRLSVIGRAGEQRGHLRIRA